MVNVIVFDQHHWFKGAGLVQVESFLYVLLWAFFLIQRCCLLTEQYINIPVKIRVLLSGALAAAISSLCFCMISSVLSFFILPCYALPAVTMLVLLVILLF